MTQTYRVLGIHGLGKQREDWFEEWKTAIELTVPPGSDVQFVFDSLYYDDIYEDVELDLGEYLSAAARLLGSRFRRQRFIGRLTEKIRWSAGYVVAWLEDKPFQDQICARAFEKIRDFQPDIIFAHSLGSLVTYEMLLHPEADSLAGQLAEMRLVTFGSQLNNDFVKHTLTPGRLTTLPVKTWHNFYNPNDRIFTELIEIYDADNFTQVWTEFRDSKDDNHHSASGYLGDDSAIAEFWTPLYEGKLDAPLHAPLAVSTRRTLRSGRKRRALLIGINDYPNPDARLDGCVNNVFLMSSVLQECGFEADDIRVCLDHRATRDGILDRMDWLVEDPLPGDERIFYFSGHGAQMAEYGPQGEPDHMLECLVPWDFDWSEDSGITDREISQFYSQLPYDLSLALIFDCCHSGGLHRDARAKKRGISPPDDIRHRALKWDLESEMWVERDFQPLNKGFARKQSVQQAYFGKNHATARLGRASLLRGMDQKDYDALQKRRDGPIGPYLPMIIESCREEEFAYEYRHGVTSYGAFTYSLASILRREARQADISFRELVDLAGQQISRLGYDQQPAILGPSAQLDAPIPWRT